MIGMVKEREGMCSELLIFLLKTPTHSPSLSQNNKFMENIIKW